MFSRNLLFLTASTLIGVQLVYGQAILDTGSTFSINGIYYFLPDKTFLYRYINMYTAIVASRKSFDKGLIPVTIINPNTITFNLAALKGTVKTFS